METLSFTDCTLAKLDDLFGLTQIDPHPSLTAWLQGEATLLDWEQAVLTHLQPALKRHVHDWNEVELLQNFIGPIFSLVNFSTERFSLFAERPFKGVVNGIKLHGRPDGLIASGTRAPKRPYFCFSEYKREKDPHGDPAGQALAAMLVAQTLNDAAQPVYGCYVRGRDWFFMSLQGQSYGISAGHMATRPPDLEDIVRILKLLKQIISNLANKESPQINTNFTN